MFNHTPIEKFDIKSKTTFKGRFYTIDDEQYPSITTMLGATGDKEWLEDWRNMLGPKKADKESKRCADRGTAVHDICEKYINNEDDFKVNHDIENIKLFNKLKMKLKKIDNVKAQEIVLYSKTLGIAGRTDCIAEYNGILSVIDFKTSNNTKSIDQIDDYILQCTFYAIAFSEMYDIPITQIVIMIAVEKSIMPQVYVKDIDKNYISKLLLRIKEYKDK